MSRQETFSECILLRRGFPGSSGVKNLSANGEDIGSLGLEDPLEEEMATHFSIFAWKIPWTEQLGGIQSVGLQSQT